MIIDCGAAPSGPASARAAWSARCSDTPDGDRRPDSRASCGRSRCSSWPASTVELLETPAPPVPVPVRRSRRVTRSPAPAGRPRGWAVTRRCAADAGDVAGAGRRDAGPAWMARDDASGWAVCTLGVLVVALVVLAAVLIPWHRPPAPRADQLAALGELPARPGRPGPGVPRRAAAGLVRRDGGRPGRRAGARPDPARRAAGRRWPAGRSATTGSPRPCSAGWPWCSSVEVVTLPFAAWRHTVAASRYGLSTQTWGGWAVDLLKSYAVGAVIGGGGAARLLHRGPARAALVVGVRARPARRRWWCCCRSSCRCWSSRSSTSSRRWPTGRCAPS